MKVKIEEYYGDGWSTSDELSIHAEGNGVKNSLHFANGEPEDNNISRNFSDVRRIADLIIQAYEAGRAGEEFRLDYDLTKIEESD